MESQDGVAKDGMGGKIGGPQCFGGVSGDVADDMGWVFDELESDNEGVAGDLFPCADEEVVRDKPALNDGVDVGVPALGVGVPFDFEKRHSTSNTALPKC